jgi:hypothetical protein
MVSAQASKGENGKQTVVYPKGVDLAGKVSIDRKTLVANDDNIWIVNNAEMLKGLEGRDVTLKCRMDPDHHAIRVLFVVVPETKQAGKFNDSAFRR